MSTPNSAVEELLHDDLKRQNPTMFDEDKVLHDLKHYLPAQAPLKDFIHHNTLHSFQYLKFNDAIRHASEMFGYKTGLSIEEYRELYQERRIREDILDKVIADRKGPNAVKEWKRNLLSGELTKSKLPRIGALRSGWKRQYKLDLDSIVHPLLFRIICSYLDQGISMWNFPVSHKGFLTSIAELEKNSFTSFFRTKRVRTMLLEGHTNLTDLLTLVVGDNRLFKQYLYDQQFAHQGWSGMVSSIEDQPQTLLDTKNIKLKDVITFELLLEIDALDFSFGEGKWKPLSAQLKNMPVDLFAEVPETEYTQALALWQEAFEWTYYDQVLAGIHVQREEKREVAQKTFQAMFCIDDREFSLRHYLEKVDPACETFGTPGFFSVEFFFQPEHGKFYTKLCPAPVTPKFLIKEQDTKAKLQKDVHFTKHSHTLFRGWLISQTLGFWSAFRLFLNIFRPTMGPATATSFQHMDKFSTLTIENKDPNDRESNLQIGFTIAEMTDRVEALLKSIGLVKNFAPIVYVVGHGSSSVNNPHYAAYDCGACSGRPGSVNARVICHMANHPEVRNLLRSREINIPSETQFVGGIHDTTRDEVMFFDEKTLNASNSKFHPLHETVFNRALDLNSKERSRRFLSVDPKKDPKKIHEDLRLRSVSLFEPRPELNHATNALCIVGRRSLTKKLFLDRRAFLNSYDYNIDPEGKFLVNIMKPLGPVCGGINLEYFFSRVDNNKLGAGTKLPHNVMGLFGVANGIDGDLRPGLPSQMIEVHDPIRLMIIVEHYPQVVLKTVQATKEMYEWFINEWVHLIAMHPETHELFLFKEGGFVDYKPLKQVDSIPDVTPIIESNRENLPVYVIQETKL
jgi:uncharacterized protein YbcC (UPF0753/DUF2309 family)